MEEKYLLPLTYAYKDGYAGKVAISRQVFEDMVLQLRAGEGRWDYSEKACILGCDAQGEVVRFFFDMEGVGDKSSYRLDTASLEKVICIWKKQYDVDFIGLIHTHTREDALCLSPKDLRFTKALLELNPGLKRIIMGIHVKGTLKLFCFERDFLFV